MSILPTTIFRKLRRKSPLAPGQLEMRDDQLSGWFNSATGELAPGFTISESDVYADIGCGEGSTARFAGKLGAEVIVTDIHRECVDRTVRKLHRTPARRIQGHVSDSNPLPIADDSCSRVVCMEVMEHVSQPKSFISELARIARPNALLLLTVPDPTSESIQQRLAPDVYWQAPNHLRIFSREEFAATVRDAGLVIESHFLRGFFASMYWALFWVADRDLGAPESPVLVHWRATWQSLLNCHGGSQVKETLDQALPKSQCIIARKPSR